MATSIQGNYITADSSADLHLNQYYIAILDANRKAALATGATSPIAGVIDRVHYEGTNGLGSVSIAVVNGNGTGKVKVGAALAKGTLITAGAAGKAVAAVQTTAGQQPTQWVIGQLLEASSADGDVVEYMKMYFPY